MKYIKFTFILAVTAWGLSSCTSGSGNGNNATGDTTRQAGQNGNLAAPYATPSAINFSKVIGWSGGQLPQAPAGFTVKQFAGALENPRWIYVASNGDIFVAEASTQKKGVTKVRDKIIGKAKSENVKSSGSANRITLFRDTDHDGVADERSVFLQNLNQPLGMLILNNYFYVANTDGLLRFPYKAGQTAITAAGQKIMDLPAGGYNNHWTRNIIANAAGTKIYVSVGSGSNVGENGMEHEVRRANILEINPDGSGERIYAAGLRNPVGMAWATGTGTLWTAVNERDGLGDELVPDYVTSVKEGGFYGWPYTYWGKHPDPRMEGQGKELLDKTIVPDVSLGAHTASLGLAFDREHLFPAPYSGGAFIGQHGSWNRSELTGYGVVFIPFKDGRPSGAMQDFLTGFRVPGKKDEVYGRPVGVAFTGKYMLVADDAGNTVFSVLPPAK